MRLKKQRITTVALISFTDIIFLLLIFILISSSFITQSGIKVNLPAASSKESQYRDRITVTLTENLEIYLNDEDTAIERQVLPERLREMLIDDPEQVVVIKSDENVPLKYVVDLLEIAKRSGTSQFFIGTQIAQQDDKP